MSNYYIEFSAILQIPKGEREKADKIIKQMERKLKEDLHFVEWQENGLWFHCEESANIEEHVEPLARALVDKLKLPENVFILDYSFTCDRPVVGAYGGAAFVVMKGHDTKWVCPGEIVSEWLEDMESDDELKCDKIFESILEHIQYTKQRVRKALVRLRAKKDRNSTDYIRMHKLNDMFSEIDDCLSLVVHGKKRKE